MKNRKLCAVCTVYRHKKNNNNSNNNYNDNKTGHKFDKIADNKN